METVSDILFAVGVFAVFLSWLVVIGMCFESKGRLITRRRKKWSLCLEALFCSLGGLVVVPAVFFAVSAFQELGLWHGFELGSLIFCLAFVLWFYASGRIGLWESWRHIFSQHPNERM